MTLECRQAPTRLIWAVPVFDSLEIVPLGLCAELAQMVVGVEITQAHPFAGGHETKVWMTGPHETFGNLREGNDSAFKVCDILLEFNWTSAA